MTDKTESSIQPALEFTPLKNLTGAAIAATLATLLYGFTSLIATKLAANPIASTNNLTIRISLLVRKVLLTLGSAASMIFGIIALGLLLFTLQQIVVKVWQQFQAKKI